ncbi:hypothetical protein V6N13_050337 [Hibiscus sabdariffa]
MEEVQKEGNVDLQQRHQAEFSSWLKRHLIDIIELDYCNKNKVFIFKCDWWNVDDKKNGLRTNGDLISVNVSRNWYTCDPFVLATQAEQVFYIDDVKNRDNWKIVQKTNHRHIFNVPEVEGNESDLAPNDDPYQQFEPDSSDVHQINIESNESLNQETKVEEIDSSFLSSKSGSMLNERIIHTSLFDGDDEDDYDDDTILNYLDDSGSGHENEDIDEEEKEKDEDKDDDDDEEEEEKEEDDDDDVDDEL